MSEIRWTLYRDSLAAWVAFSSSSESYKTEHRAQMESWLSAQGLRTEEIEKLFHDAKENGEATINASVPPMGKRKAIAISILVFFVLMLITDKFYTTKMIFGKLWAGFWVFAIFVGVWLIVAIERVLRKGP